MKRSLASLAFAMGLIGLFAPAVHADTKTSTKADAKVADVAKAPVTPQPKTYEVQSGDSLSTIAVAQGLDSWRPLWNINDTITDPDMIYPGQKLTVPNGQTTDRPLPAGISDAVPQQQVQAIAPVRHTTAANYADGIGGILARVRMRESGGNYATNTGNGYYGAYQFTVGTWQGVGGTGLPSDASAAEQDMRAQMLYNIRGCSPWPNTCY